MEKLILQLEAEKALPLETPLPGIITLGLREVRIASLLVQLELQDLLA